MHYKVETVIEALQKSWTGSTSSSKAEWSEDNPARGQCVVSCLVIQQILGGTLKRFKVTYRDKVESHYINVLSNGIEIDSTLQQYPPSTPMIEAPINLQGYKSVKAKLLSDADTKRRYERLLQRVKGSLKGPKRALPNL